MNLKEIFKFIIELLTKSGGKKEMESKEILTKFDDIIEIVLEHEGGYVNDPKDPGGETNFGVAKRSHPDVDIKNLTKEVAKEI